MGEREVVVMLGLCLLRRVVSQEARPAQLPAGRSEPMRMVTFLVGAVVVDVILVLLLFVV